MLSSLETGQCLQQKSWHELIKLVSGGLACFEPGCVRAASGCIRPCGCQLHDMLGVPKA